MKFAMKWMDRQTESCRLVLGVCIFSLGQAGEWAGNTGWMGGVYTYDTTAIR